MRESTIARNYAEALLELGEASDNTQLYVDLMDAVAGAIAADHRIKVAIESPRVAKVTKEKILANALSGYAPEEFIRFLRAVVKRNRQSILGSISEEYQLLVDEKMNRVHASVVLARNPDEDLKEAIRKRLSEIVNKEVIAHYRTDADILGGVMVRIGDRTMDGSVRRKLKRLRKQLLSG